MSLIDVLSKGFITWTENDVMFYVGAAITLILCYLIGSFDIRHIGKFSDGSKISRIVAIIVDILEGLLAVIIGAVLMPGDGFSYVALFGMMLGHVFPLYFRFEGNNCIFVFCAGTLILNPIASIFAIVVGIAVLMFSKYVSASNMTIAAIFPIINFYLPFSLFTMNTETMMGMINYLLRLLVPILMTAVVVVAHINNIKNLIKGTEEKYIPKS